MARESNRFRRAAELAGVHRLGADRMAFSDERAGEIAAALLDCARREVARCSRTPGTYEDAAEIVRALRLAVGLATAERKELSADFQPAAPEGKP